MRRPHLIVVVLAHALLLVAAAVVLYPVLWVLKLALTPGQSFTLGWSPIPTTVTLANFLDVITAHDPQGPLFVWQLANSLIVATGTAAVGLSVSATAAYALSRWDYPGRDATLGAFLVSQMFPGVVMAIPLYLMLDVLGLLDQLAGLVLVYSVTSVPFSTWTLKGYFDTIPKELEEAAMLDGASRFGIFWRVVLPLARPALAVTGLFSFMTAWNEYILAATLITNPRALTLPVVLQRYVDDHGTQWGHFAAGSVLVSIPVVVLFFVLQRYFVGGLTAGGVKG